ncbi:MAG: PQQ-binding-like beta-propeller repeat protein [Chloroflexota bacterium]
MAIVAGCGGGTPASPSPVSGSPGAGATPSATMPGSSAVAGNAKDVTTYRGDAARTGVMPGPGPLAAPVVAWSFDASAPIGSSVAVVGGVVYLVGSNGTVHALDLGTGHERWKVALGVEAHSSPTVIDGLVIVGTDDGVHALRAADGTAAWSTPGIGPVGGALAVTEETGVFADGTGTVGAIDIRTGKLTWKRDEGAPDTRSVATDGQVAIVGIDGGTIIALSLADGTERWRTGPGDPAGVGSPTIADGRVFAATGLGSEGPGTHHLVALDLATGKLLWRYASPKDVAVYTPAISDGRAIVDGEDSTVTALDPATGKVVWTSPAPGVDEVVAAVVGATVYSASNGGFAFALDAATGAERWRLAIQGVPYGAVVTGGMVLVGTDGGTLYAIGGTGG